MTTADPHTPGPVVRPGLAGLPPLAAEPAVLGRPVHRAGRGGDVRLHPDDAQWPELPHAGHRSALLLIPIILVTCGLLLWFSPAQRLFYSIVAGGHRGLLADRAQPRRLLPRPAARQRGQRPRLRLDADRPARAARRRTGRSRGAGGRRAGGPPTGSTTADGRRAGGSRRATGTAGDRVPRRRAGGARPLRHRAGGAPSPDPCRPRRPPADGDRLAPPRAANPACVAQPQPRRPAAPTASPSPSPEGHLGRQRDHRHPGRHRGPAHGRAPGRAATPSRARPRRRPRARPPRRRPAPTGAPTGAEPPRVRRRPPPSQTGRGPAPDGPPAG